MSEKKRTWNSDKIISLCAMFISICTLIVFVYQTSLVRKQQYMSVFPHVMVGHVSFATKNYQLILVNQGIGPAILKDIRVIYKDKVFEGDLAQFLEITQHVNTDSIDFYYSNIVRDMLIPANEQVVLLGNKGTQINGKHLFDILHDENLRFELEYESIYGERWKIEDISATPIKLK